MFNLLAVKKPAKPQKCARCKRASALSELIFHMEAGWVTKTHSTESTVQVSIKIRHQTIY